MPHSKLTLIGWALRLVAAGILLQTLYFKFTGAPESVYIFSTLGLEPEGRIGSGIAELIAAVLILNPSTVVYGAGLSLAIISGAIASHLTKLGIALPLVDDHGELFALAVTVWACAFLTLFLHFRQIPLVGRKLTYPN